LSIETLSDVPFFAARPSREVAPKRKAASWIAVGIVHLLLLGMLMVSQTFPDLVLHGGEHETILDLTGSQDTQAPDVKMVIPQAPVGTPPEILETPVPPTPLVEQPVIPQEGGQQRGDVLGAIGREIACSAGNYENLTEAQRSRCPRIPWQGAIIPNGAIVLNRPQGTNRFAPPPSTDHRLSGGDDARLKVERSSPCPMMTNIPCLNRIPGMDDR